MRALRALMRRRRSCFALLLACTLAVRLIVPAGFMPAMDGGGLSLRICSGMASGSEMAAMPAMPHGGHGEHDGEGGGKAQTPCAFAGIGMAALGGADPVLLLAALLFAFLLASRAAPWPLPKPPSRLRPPLRAPPAAA